MATRTEPYTDTEIIQKVTKGETALFEVLIRRNNALLYKTGRSYNFRHDDTLDLMQEAFIDAFSNLAKFEFRSSFRTWLLRIFLNNCFRKQQKSDFKNETHIDLTDKSPMHFNNHHDDVNRTVINKELGRVIEKALAKIPFDYRIVFTLREINGLDVEETAEVLRISKANVKTRLNRAKSMLRSEVEKFYSPEDIFEFNLRFCDRVVENVLKAIEQRSNK